MARDVVLADVVPDLVLLPLGERVQLDDRAVVVVDLDLADVRARRPLVPAKAGEATRWLRQWMKETKMKHPNMEELPSFEELFAKSIKKAVHAMPVEERLEGLTPEQRLGTLAPSQVIPALPLDVLRVLPEEYLRSLPEEVQQQVRMRLQGAH